MKEVNENNVLPLVARKERRGNPPLGTKPKSNDNDKKVRDKQRIKEQQGRMKVRHLARHQLEKLQTVIEQETEKWREAQTREQSKTRQGVECCIWSVSSVSRYRIPILS